MMQYLQHGSGTKVLINGKAVAFATGISVSRTTNNKVIYEIDSPYPAEIAPTSYMVSGSLNGLRIRDGGGLDGSNIMPLSVATGIFNQKYCTLEVVDRMTGKSIMKIDKVLFDSDSWSIQSRQLLTFSATFKGIYLVTEASSSNSNTP